MRSYRGLVLHFDPYTCAHAVLYDDDQREDLRLWKETVTLISNELGDPAQALGAGSPVPNFAAAAAEAGTEAGAAATAAPARETAVVHASNDLQAAAAALLEAFATAPSPSAGGAAVAATLAPLSPPPFGDEGGGRSGGGGVRPLRKRQKQVPKAAR